MPDKMEFELMEVNLMTALGFYSMVSSIELMDREERAHELGTSLSVEVCAGALQRQQKVVGWREALLNEMNLKDNEEHHRTTGSKYFVGSSSAAYCNSKNPTHIVNQWLNV